MNRLWKIPFVALLAVFMLVSFSFTVDAAEKLPYEYEFEVTNDTYNGFKGVKKMVITFDKDISSTVNYEDVVSIKQIISENETPEVPIMQTVEANGKKLTITFKNLEFVDYSKGMKFKLEIPKDILYFDQLNAYEFPFEFYDLLPGFESTFISGGTSTLINTNIFKHNAPLDVMIHVPSIYLTKIETMHRYNGLVGPGTAAPSLANIDVTAHEDVQRLKVKFTASGTYEDEYGRDLERRTDSTNFSMGQAGITAQCVAEGQDCTAGDDFYLTAYDGNGRLLSTKVFKMRVVDRDKDFKVNDYVEKPHKVFGTTVSLHALMSSPELLDGIIQNTEVSGLDKLGVTYSLGNSIKVENAEQLDMALANNDFKTIELAGNINLNGFSDDTLFVNRSVTIKGGTLVGNVVLGDGTDNLTVRLDGVTVVGDLTIDVGTEGTAIISTSTVSGTTTVLSGAEKSIHLHDFTSKNGIVIENIAPVRIVMSYSNGSSVEKNMKMNLGSNKAVMLEGLVGELTVNVATGNNAQLTVKNSEGSIVAGNEGTQGTLDLKVSPEVNTPASTPAGWTVAKLETVVEDGKSVIEKNYSSPLNKSKIAWEESGESLTLIELGLPEGFNPTVENPNVFGSQSEVTFKNSTLMIKGNPEPKTADVILRDEINGKIYKLKVNVTVNEATE